MMMQQPPATQALLGVCIGISVLELGSCAIFYRRRHITPIRERLPLVAIISHVSITTHLSLVLFVIAVRPNPCFPIFIVQNYAGSVSGMATFLRYLNLYLTFRLNRAKIFASSSMPVLSNISRMVPIKSMTLVDQWLLTNKWVLTWRLQVPYFVAVITLVTIFNVYSATIPNIRSASQCTRPEEVAVIMQMWYLVLTLMLGCLALLMRIVVDAYHIKWELLIHLRLSLLQIGMWMIPPLSDFDQTRFPVLSLSYFVMAQVGWVITIVLPIRWSYKAYGVTGMSKLRIQEIMQRPDALDALQQFLINEFCIENLYFLLAVQQLQRLKRSAASRASMVLSQATTTRVGLSLANFRQNLFEDDGVVANTVADIYRMFCVQSSAFAINISSEQLQYMEANVGTGDPNLFQGAVKEIEKLLEHDSLPRFFASNLGRQWCLKA